MTHPQRRSRWPHPVVIGLLGMLPALPALAGEYRFPEKPWGLDTPAGRCVVCHSLEKGGPRRVAPNLWNIYGAEKARDVDTFVYSQALLEKDGTWTDEDLDAFLKDASRFAPGSSKSIRVASDEERKRIIEFLRSDLRD